MHPATVQLMRVYREVFGASERAGAIVIVAFIDDLLLEAIFLRLRELNKSEQKDLVDGPRAPLSTLSAKIHFGYALFLYSAAVRDDMLILKNMRNKFAHSIAASDFNHEEVIKLCERLHFPSFAAQNSGQPEQTNLKQRFTDTAYFIMSGLRQMTLTRAGVARIGPDVGPLHYPARDAHPSSRKKVGEGGARKNRVRDRS